MDDKTELGIFILVAFILGAFIQWTNEPLPRIQEVIKETINTETKIVLDKKIWSCNSVIGNINNHLVLSRKEPTYLPVPGNEKLDFYCRKKELTDFEEYKPQF